MTITEFKAYVKTGQALDTDEIHGFMHEMSEEEFMSRAGRFVH